MDCFQIRLNPAVELQTANISALCLEYTEVESAAGPGTPRPEASNIGTL